MQEELICLLTEMLCKSMQHSLIETTMASFIHGRLFKVFFPFFLNYFNYHWKKSSWFFFKFFFMVLFNRVSSNWGWLFVVLCRCHLHQPCSQWQNSPCKLFSRFVLLLFSSQPINFFLGLFSFFVFSAF